MKIIAVAALASEDAEAAIRTLSECLNRAGCVRETYADAVVARESLSPTAIPMPGGAVALPHADPEHVHRPAIAVATTSTPLSFRQMGTPERQLEVSVVILLALPTPGDAQNTLVNIVRTLQREENLVAITGAASDADLLALAEDLWRS